MTIKIDPDRAVKRKQDDNYGFVGIANRLAPSILDAVKGEGLTIGLEGQWGSGKTSLLNYVHQELVKGEKDDIYTISVTPWLNGDAANLVESLLNPMSKILTEVEKKKMSTKVGPIGQAKDKAKEVGSLINDYTQKTARNLAPIASVVGTVVPGLGGASKALENSANVLESFKNKATPAELKEQISKKIKDLDVGFIIILDDLDRLEPGQAVEVVRLVRSVADFPNVIYLMCYDKDVLAEALKTGLKIKNGDLYLQKIVQLAFAIPLPEPFDLRTQFCHGAEEIFKEVTGECLGGDILDDLKSAVDREGAELSTPREVKLALNGISFIYPTIKEDVYFPDLCRLHLIKTTHLKLYRWLEEYLAVRSILISRDGNLNIEYRKKLGKELKRLLPSDDIGALNSIWSLGRFVPGLVNNKKPEKCLFSEVTEKQAHDSILFKRLGSPLHYRFYFALTGPKTVMTDDEFNSLLDLAKENVEQLKSKFIEHAQSFRISGKTWLEHVFDRLDTSYISQLDVETASGLIFAISDIMDIALMNDKPRAFDFGISHAARCVVEDLFSCLKKLDPQAFNEVSKTITADAKAINWLVGYFFSGQMWDHGKVGNQSKPENERIFTDEQLENLLVVIRRRLAYPNTQNTFSTFPKLSCFLYAWCEISGEKTVKEWVDDYCKADEGFLNTLNHLRHWSMSDKVYHPLSEESIKKFFDLEEALGRLDSLAGGKFENKVQDLKAAVKHARNR